MTREKAIEVLENGAWWDLLIPITTIEGRKSDIELHEALDIAIAALRNGWISVEDRLPEDGKIVETKIDDGKFIRNIQKLKRKGNLWFLPDGSMYVYYSPTHWKL